MSSAFLTGTNEEAFRRPESFQTKKPVKTIVDSLHPQNRPVSAFRYQKPPEVEDPAKKEEKIIESWNALRAKIRGYESRPAYVSDESHTNIRPGLRFWEYIVLANPRIEKPRLMVPYSLVNCPGNQQYLISTDPVTGRLAVNSEANYPEFEKFLLRRMEESIDGPNRDTTFAQYTGIEPGTKKPDFEAKKNLEFEILKKEKMRKLEEKKEKQYFYIMRKRNNDNEASTEVFTYNKWSQSRSNILSFDDNSILQEYIYPRGPNACITRLFFFTKHNKEMKANFGYKIRNKYQLHDDKADRVGMDQLAVVNKTDDPKIGAFTVNHLAGVSLVEYEAYAEELVSFLERAYPVRIKSITLDFITDHLKRHVLFNVKDIDLDHMEQTSKDPNEKKRTLDELTCSVYCKLCGLIFKKDEASKTLTYKLLWELAQHLKKRGKGLHGIEVSHSSTRPCRVCDLCYMVVVSEHELIELEQQFARVQNIPISDPYLRVPIEKKAKHRPALLGETLKQWRFMIYLQTLNFEGENLFKTNNIDKDSVHLQVKLFRIKNDFPLNLVEIAKDPNSTIEDGYDYTYSYEINLLRVYYFFSDKQDIKNFLQDTELQVRITYTKDWNNYIAQGSTRTLSQFDNNRLKGQKHESRIYMFFDSAEYCTIRFTAGLVCDGDFNTASMNLHKFNGIYFPNDDFYNCNIFPEEWIEIFMDEKRDDPNKDGNEGFETKGKPYTPVCTPAEMRKMLEPNHHSNRIEVETKVEHRLDTKKHEEFKKQLRLEKETKKSRPYSMYSNQDDAVTMQTNLKATYKQPDGDLAIGGPSGRPGTGASFRLRKPQTADPRKPKTNRDQSVDSDTEMYIKKQVREYKEQEKVDPLGGLGRLVDTGAKKHEIFDNSEDFEQEYGAPSGPKAPKRVASGQEHRRFLNKYQLSAQGIARADP